MEDKTLSIPRKGFADYDPFYILDSFLKILTIESVGGRTSRSYIDYDKIHHELKEKEIHLDHGEFNNIADKLLKDGFIKVNQIGNNISYKITFEGFLFIKQGGYNYEQKQKIKKNRAVWLSSFWNIINALAVIILTLVSIYIQYKANSDRDNLQNALLKINRLESELNTLKHKTE